MISMKRNNSFLRVMIFITVTALITGSCNTPEQKAENRINSFLEKSGTVGLAVVVVKDNQIIYSHAFGNSSIENNIRLNVNDIFRIASISKSFTTTALLSLAEKNLISLEQDVSDLVGFKVRNPKFPDVPITLRMLLSHSSSLNDSQGYFSLDFLNPDVNPDYTKCYNEYMPGTKYQYCNLAFNTIGAIIEKVSGVRFDKYVNQTIVQPLSLLASFNVDDFSVNKFASLYTADTIVIKSSGKPGFILSESAYLSLTGKLDSGKYIMGYSAPIFSPTGGMKISAPDLARYMIMHMNHGINPQSGIRIIGEESSKLMQTPVIETDEKSYYCLGLNRTTTLLPGEIMTGHTGSAYGLLSAMYFEPEKKFGIVIITNGTSQEYATYVDGYAPVQRDIVRLLYNVFIK
jgi:CubicO group peptidase (beta-lactamase class C family)